MNVFIYDAEWSAYIFLMEIISIIGHQNCQIISYEASQKKSITFRILRTQAEIKSRERKY